MTESAAANREAETASHGLAFLFPGQGSQQVGMGQALLDTSPAAREVFDRADAALGWRLSRLCLQGPEADLTRTENLQPALFVVSLAALAALRERFDLRPRLAMGHSLGEYAALVSADALEFREALQAVRRRGELMAAAVEDGAGAMAAVIGLEPEVLEQICLQAAAGQVLAVANYNCPGQLVVSGHTQALERAEPLCKRAGAKGVIRLKVSAPFHCELMRPAADRLAEVLAGLHIRSPRFPVLSNVTGAPHQQPEAIRAALVEQLVRPVRWMDSVAWARERGVEHYLELGPGKVLAGLLKRIDRSCRIMGVCDPQAVTEAGAFVGFLGA